MGPGHFWALVEALCSVHPIYMTKKKFQCETLENGEALSSHNFTVTSAMHALLP